MQKYAALIAIAVVILYGIYNAQSHKSSTHKPTPSQTYAHHLQHHGDTQHAAEELARLDTPRYIRDYITHVIVHGSDTLGFNPDEVMEPGFASREDAPRIACYVMTLRGKTCDDPQIEQAQGYYTSICGGCHGNDGKGTGGAYPDLTRRPLLGIEQRAQSLRRQLTN
jgi:cytochrome c553